MLDAHSQPLTLCEDPLCPGWVIDDAQHFERHNPRCATVFAAGGSEELCALAPGHSPPCRSASGAVAL